MSLIRNQYSHFHSRSTMFCMCCYHHALIELTVFLLKGKVVNKRGSILYTISTSYSFIIKHQLPYLPIHRPLQVHIPRQQNAKRHDIIAASNDHKSSTTPIHLASLPTNRNRISPLQNSNCSRKSLLTIPLPITQLSLQSLQTSRPTNRQSLLQFILKLVDFLVQFFASLAATHLYRIHGRC
jgi:hypothetical protein